MTTSEAGFNLIKGFEELRLVAYKDSAGIPTIGYGSTRYNNGSLVEMGDHITVETADLLLITKVRYFEQIINRSVYVPLTQNQFDALVSLAYNIGDAITHSTLVRLLNAKAYAAAADQFLVWNKITVKGVHVVAPGLSARRAKEKALFLS